MKSPIKQLLRTQLSLVKRVMADVSIDTARMTQDGFGALTSAINVLDVDGVDFKLGSMDACMFTPKECTSPGIILYIHGGGFTCGDLAYSKGFASTLSAKCGIKVMCFAYRLAPENRYPCALEDTYFAYEYLLKNGYTPKDIIICGESAGGGLCYSLCLKLKEKGEIMPAGIVSISAWTDLTLTNASFEKNKENDPSMTREMLSIFADAYLFGGAKGENPLESQMNPMVSPIYGDLTGLPPSILFVGSDEIMLDDTLRLHEKLLECGCQSELHIAPEMWHAYMLYSLSENDEDFERIRRFTVANLNKPAPRRWMKLDNIGNVYPAVKTKTWINTFRLSANLTEKIDKRVMQSALDVTVKRFPSMAVRLRTGFFWYYLEELDSAPKIQDEHAYPFARTLFDDIRKCALRVLIYENRVAVEFFHSITDGNGGLIFLKTLISEYLYQKHGKIIPNRDGVLDRFEEPSDEELEDSVKKYAGTVAFPRAEKTAFKITGTPARYGYKTNTTFMFDATVIKAEAKKRGVTVTAFMASALILASMRLQDKKMSTPWRKKPLKVFIPVNLRNIFPSKSLRNFVLFVMPGIEAKYGPYSFDDICRSMSAQMKYMLTPQQMSARMAANLNPEKSKFLRLFPLFLKNLVMRVVFYSVGEKKTCLSLSNLGEVKMPEELSEHITRMDFLLDVQSHAPYNSALITYNKKMYLNLIRNIEECDLERELYEVFRELRIKVKAESNQRLEDK